MKCRKNDAADPEAICEAARRPTMRFVRVKSEDPRGRDGLPHSRVAALHLLVDSTGIKVEGEGEWSARKHGGAKRRVWRKIHIGIDEKTLEIR